MGKAIGKTFWINKEVALNFKIKCVESGAHQQDVIELLMIKWLNNGKGKRKG